MKFRLQRRSTHSLSLRERSQRKRQCKDGCCENESCVVLAYTHRPQHFPDSPKLTGVTIRGLCLSQSVFCNLTRTKGGRTMIGVAFSTRLIAVSPTASVAAFLLRPSDLYSSSPLSTFCFSSSVKTGKTSMPWRISSPRIRNTLSTPALATAAKGTRRLATIFALGERLFSRGTRALRPNATPHEAVTAVKYDLTMVDVDSGVDLFAFEKLMPTLSD